MKKSKNYLTNSTLDTGVVASTFARTILQGRRGGRAVVLGLVGEFGAGKTTFTRRFIRELGVKRRILSPTFVIMKRFSLPPATGFKDVYHIDAYRVESEDLLDLGWNEIIKERNIVIVEWALRVKKIMPTDTTWIHFKHCFQENERKIIFNRR